jgi:hypothetical protein
MSSFSDDLELLNKDRPQPKTSRLYEEAMPEPEKGAFMSFIDWLDRPGQAVRATLSGDIGRAGRHLLDFVGEVPDAFLPGDVIPDATRQRDFRDPSELVGMDQDAPWYLKMPVDLAVGVATDPLSYLTFGGAGALTNVAKAGTKAGAAANLGIKAGARAEDAISLLTKNLSRAGKKALKGDDFISDIVQKSSKESVLSSGRVVDEVDFDMLGRFVKGDSRFNQGGTRFLGKQVSKHDPLSAGFRQVKKGAAKGLEMLPESVQANLGRSSVNARNRAKEAYQSIKSALGWSNPGPLKNALQNAMSIGSASGRAASEAAEKIADDLTHHESYAITSIFHNVFLDPKTGVPTRILNPEGDDFIKMGSWDVHAKDSIAKLKELGYDIDEARIMDKVQQIHDLSKRWVDESVDAGAWSKQNVFIKNGETFGVEEIADEFAAAQEYIRGAIKATEKGMKGLSPDDTVAMRSVIEDLNARLAKTQDEWAKEAGYVTAQDVRSNPFYLQRIFKGTKQSADDIAVLTGSPSALKSRTLTSGEDIMDFLKGQEDLWLEPDAAKALRNRAQQQGRIMQRAKAAKEIFGEDTIVSDPVVSSAMANLLKNAKVAEPELYQSLQRMFEGIPPQGPFLEFLNKASAPFKRAAVMGFVLPKASSIIRNRIGGLWQAASTGVLTKADIARASRDVAEAFADAYPRSVGAVIPKSQLSSKLSSIDNAFASSDGTIESVRKALAKDGHDDLVSAIDNGVLDGFVSTEGLLRKVARYGKKDKGFGKRLRQAESMWQDPAVVFQGVESRMRMATYLDLLQRGYDPKAASSLVADTYLDYSVTSGANKTLRSIFPFMSFFTGSIKQQAALVRKHPVAGVAYAQVVGSSGEEPVADWIEEQPHARIGEGKYLTGLGLPIDVLAKLPVTGRGVERDIVGMLNPLLKTGYSKVTGRDPFFGSKAFTYDKVFGKSSEAGRLYNQLASTGLIQPIEYLVSQAEQATDDRRTVGERVFNMLSGAKIVANDPERALLNKLEGLLEDDPNVRFVKSAYTKSDDEATRLLLKAQKEAKAAVRAKNKAKKDAQSVQ